MSCFDLLWTSTQQTPKVILPCRCSEVPSLATSMSPHYARCLHLPSPSTLHRSRPDDGRCSKSKCPQLQGLTPVLAATQLPRHMLPHRIVTLHRNTPDLINMSLPRVSPPLSSWSPVLLVVGGWRRSTSSLMTGENTTLKDQFLLEFSYFQTEKVWFQTISWLQTF